MLDKNELQPFFSVLDSLLESEEVAVHLLFRLSDMSAAEFEDFKQRWHDAPAERRRIIIRHLVDISEENYVVDFMPVFSLALEDESAGVRVAALDGFWDTTDSSLINPTLRLMQTDPSLEVRAAAASALSHFILLAEWGQIPRPFSSRIVAALLNEYELMDTAVPIKRAALEALGAADHPRVEALIEDAYHSGDTELQISAIFAMGSSADERWLPAIQEQMDSSLVEMRVEAARAAGIIGHEDVLPGLARLAADEDLEVSTTAVTALGQMGGEVALRILTMMAEDEDFCPFARSS